MTKFIDNTSKDKKETKTVFNQTIELNTLDNETLLSADDFDTVEYIGQDVYGRSVFKCFHNSNQGIFRICLGVKGDEF